MLYEAPVCQFYLILGRVLSLNTFFPATVLTEERNGVGTVRLVKMSFLAFKAISLQIKLKKCINVVAVSVSLLLENSQCKI